MARRIGCLQLGQNARVQSDKKPALKNRSSLAPCMCLPLRFTRVRYVTCFVLVNSLFFGLQDFVRNVCPTQTLFFFFVVFRVPQPKCVNVAIDCDREIERIHSLFLINLDKLDELQSKFSPYCLFKIPYLPVHMNDTHYF